MSEQPAPEMRQIVVHPAIWDSLEAWLGSRGIELGQIPTEHLGDDLPTYVMIPAQRHIDRARRELAGEAEE
ncbi:hypothetical protein [Streptomyces sp. H27-H5]|uniref:hypothetical protein n=1 Tax=Streptomyces sp. H27-H5 TaxID=2996460 RepID=UPI002272078D|nr:hypothetical protein [Streptomyces sp. H27-H5]MCY0959945.1 hypothetical protein [Streptomyces sp. H27-H5]